MIEKEILEQLHEVCCKIRDLNLGWGNNLSAARGVFVNKVFKILNYECLKDLVASPAPLDAVTLKDSFTMNAVGMLATNERHAKELAGLIEKKLEYWLTDDCKRRMSGKHLAMAIEFKPFAQKD